MNLDQVLSLVRTLLATGGPVAGLLTIMGFPGDQTALWLGLATTVLPPIISAVWGVMTKTDAAKVAAAGAMPGVTVTVAPNASPGAQEAARDPTVPGVQSVLTATSKA